MFGKDVAVSLVDDAFIFSTQDQPNPLVLPAYAAVQTGSARVLAFGGKAKDMLGRGLSDTSVIRILTEGIVMDWKIAGALFGFGLRKIQAASFLGRPRVVIAQRSCEPKNEAVQKAAIAGGAGEVYLIEMGMATAIGMQLEASEPEIQAVLSVSDDWFEFAVISHGSILSGMNGPIGSRHFVEDIQNHIMLSRRFRPRFDALAAQVQADGVNPQAAADVPGWETWAGRTEHGRFITKTVTRDDIAVGMMPSFMRLTERVKTVIRRLPDEAQYLLNRTTIHTTGEALAIPGLAHMISEQIGYPVTPFASQVHPSIDGCESISKELFSSSKTLPRWGK